MVRVELPQSNLKARRRKRRVWLVAGAFGVVVVLATLFSFAAHASFVRVMNIIVSDTGGITEASVERLVRKDLSGSYFFIFPRDNIFLYPKQTIQDSLRTEYAVIKDAKVRAKDFQTIEVALTLRQPAALWCTQEGACGLMDEDGVVYADAPAFSAPVYVEYSGPLASSSAQTQYLGSEEFRSLFALIDALSKKDQNNQVRSVVVDETGDVRAYFQKDFLLIFSLHDDGGDVFERFSLALQSDLFKAHTLADFEYLDLRFGEKLYYKLKD